MWNRCKHQWKVLVQKTTESTFEHALRVTDSTGTIPHQLCRDNRKHIVIITCTVCGELKEKVTNL